MKKLAVLLVSMLTFAAAAFAGPYDMWSRYSTITINTTESGAGVAGTVENFPLLVRLNQSNAEDVLLEAGAGGASLRFATSDGETALPYEIEHWSETDATVWVRVPVVAGDANTTIRMYWNNDAASSESNGSAVFNAANGFAAVWHMNETVTAAGDIVSDATGNHPAVLGLFGEGAAVPTDVTSAIGIGKNIGSTNNAVGAYFEVADPDSALSFNTDVGPYTLSAWVNVTSCGSGSRSAIISKYNNSNEPSSRQFALQISGGGNNWNLTNNPVSHAETDANEFNASSACTANEWQYVSASYGAESLPTADVDGATSAMNIYVNGGGTMNVSTFGQQAASIGRSSPLRISGIADGQRFIRGSVDEVRMSSVVRSADWVKLDYETQRPTGDPIVTIGATQTQDVPVVLQPAAFDAWSSYRDIHINTTDADGGADVASTLNNYPVLVRLSSADAASGADVLAGAGANGASLRFADESGNFALPFEIDYWSEDYAAIWVRVPTVEGNANTTIRMYWGNEFVQSASSPTAVFGNNDYLAVWHMGNPSTGAQSSPRPNAATGVNDMGWGGGGTTSANRAPRRGIIAMADTLRGNGSAGNGDHFSVTQPINYPNQATTMSIWLFHATTQQGGFLWMFAGGETNTVNNIWMGRQGDGTNFRVRGAGATAETSPEGHSTIEGAITGMSGNWTHVTVTRDGNEGRRWRVFLNGALASEFVGENSNNHIFNTGPRGTHYIGRAIVWLDNTWRGKVEEARISSIARSPDWVKLDYETQREGATAVVLGESQAQTATFAYGNISPTYVVFDEIAPNVPVVNGTVENISVNPLLPAGLALDPETGVITGTPTAATAEGTYTVTAVFSEPDVIVATDLTITVNPLAPTDLVYPVTDVLYGLDAAIADNIPTVNSLSDPNQIVTNFSVSPALPAGMTLDAATGVISGTPTETSGATVYTVTASNVTGSTTAQLTIAVTAPITSLTYRHNPVVYTGGTSAPIENNPVTADAIVSSWSVSPALPAGLTLDPETGMISGTPTTAASGDYTVTATNPAGSLDEVINITVVVEDYGSWSGSQVVHLNTSAIDVSSEQSHFPVLVRLTADHAAVFNNAQDGGEDIRFSTPGGDRLVYELGHWDKDSQSAAIWVSLPTVEASGVTPLVMHWGNGSAVARSEGGRVFHTDNGYLGVWHLGNAAGADARPNSVHPGINDAVPSGNYLGSWEPRQGIISMADSLRNQEATGWQNDPFHPGQLASDHISFGAIDFPTQEVTSQFWLYYPTPQVNTGWTHFITHGNGRTNNNFWIGRVDNSNTLRSRGANNGESNPDNLADVQNVFNTYANQWVHVAVTRDGEDGRRWRVHINGTRVVDVTGGSASHNFVSGVRQHNYIGMAMWPDRNSQIKVEEYRLSSVARSADWFKLEHETQKAGAAPLYNLTYASGTYTFVEESAIDPITVTGLTGTATSFSISPELPPSLTLNVTTGEITGTPDDGHPTQTYTVTAHNGAWSASTTFDLTITPLPPSALAYADATPDYQVGIEITPNVPSYSGTINSWSIAPGLPSGLNLNTSTGVISGTPLVAAATETYVVSGVGPEGNLDVNVSITVAPPEEDFMADWPQSRDIVLNTSSTGADVSGDVHGFPLLVRLGGAEASIIAAAGDNGANLRFTKSNNVTRLPHEVVGWDADNNTAEIWVLVDTIFGDNSDQHIRMFWGNATAIDRSSGEDVFQVAQGFQAVWHMNGVSGDELDATGNNFTATHTNDPASVRGMTGDARAFNGTNQYFQVIGSAGSSLSFPVNGNYTISTWVLLDPTNTDADDNRTIVSKHDNEYALSLNGSGGNNWQFFQYANGWQTISSPRQANVWTHLVIVKDGAASRLYVNGVQTAATTTGSNPAGRDLGTDVFIARRGDQNTRHWRGYLDELRMATVSRSADWIKLEYASQITYQTLTDIGLQPPTLSYSATTVTYETFTEITPLTPGAAGPVTSITVDPELPAGLVLDPVTGVISGTPTAPAAAADYTVTATNDAGSVQAVINITVNLTPPTGLSYSVNPATYYTNTTIDPNVATVTGIVDEFSVVPDLPEGLVLNTTTGEITGAAVDITASETYVVTAENSAGSTTVDLVIEVLVAPPAAPVLIAPADEAVAVPVPVAFEWNASAPPVDHYEFQGSDDGFETSGFDTTVTETTLLVEDAPYASLLSWRVRGVNSSGPGAWSDVWTFTTIEAPPAISYANTPVIYTVNVEITPNVPTVAEESGPITGYSISPDLNDLTGLDFNETTGVISGTPDSEKPDLAPTDFTVTAIGPGGEGIAIISLGTSSEPPPVISYAVNDISFLIDEEITPLAADTTGSGPISIISVDPELPEGLTLDTETGTISGTPTALAAAQEYVVTAAGIGGFGRDTITIAVIDAPPAISYAGPQGYIVGTAITPLAPVSTGGAVVSYAALDSLPAGLTLNEETGVISGTPTAAAAAADYQIQATNSGGSVTATINIAVQGAPVITQQPVAVTLLAGGTAAFTVEATGDGALTYQWRRGGTNLANGGNISGATSTTLLVNPAALADTGAYSVVVTSTLSGTPSSTTSSNAALTVNVAPTITTQPAANTTLAQGTNGNLTVVAQAGPGSSAGTLSYQWYRNGEAVPGATSATLAITNATAANQGNYTVRVTRTLGSTTTMTESNVAAVAVNVAPTIVTQPAPTTVVAGANASFSVAVQEAGGSLGYQWRRNGTNIAGATSATYTATSVGIADTGAISVVVTRSMGGTTTSTTSSNAALLVNVAPAITSQPADSVHLAIGESFSFAVTVATTGGSSAGTLSYQWRKDGVNLTDGGRISGATAATLTVATGEEADVGDYSVVVTRTLNGTTTSTTSDIGKLVPPVSIAPGAFVIRVDNRADPFTFQLPAGSASVTERLTLSISDVYGRTIWSNTVHPSKDKVSELTWNGRTTTGRPASAGMYVVRISVRNDGNTTHYVRKTVTLKPR